MKTFSPQDPISSPRRLFLCIFFVIGFLHPSAWANDSTIRNLSGHHGEIFSLAYSPNGKFLASGSGDRTIHVWEQESGRLRYVLKGHTGNVRALSFSPDHRYLASGGSDRTSRIWDLQTGQEIQSFSIRFGNIRAIGFSPDGSTLATVGDGGSLYLWDWKAGKPQRAMKSGFDIMFAVAFSPDGRQLVTGNSDTLVHVWDAASGRQQQTFSGHSGAVHSVAFSPDGSLLASGSDDQTIRLWDIASGRERGILKGHTQGVQSVVFSQDGHKLLSAGKDGTVRIWDWKSGRQLGSFTEHKGPIWALAYAPQANTFASGGRDRIVRVQKAEASDRIVARSELPQAQDPGINQEESEIGPPPSPPPFANVRLAIQPHEVKPGQPLKIHLIVKNSGKGPLYRFQARTKSANALFNGHLFNFGKIPAGKSRSKFVLIKVPEEFTDAETALEILFKEHNGFIPDSLHAALNLTGSQRPRLAYNYQILDDGSGQSVGNGDGRIQKGEAVDLLLTLRNVGPVIAPNTWVEMTNGPGQLLEIRPHMIRFGKLKPDESKQVRMNFTVWPDFQADQVQLKLFIQEKAQQVFLNEDLRLPVDSQPAQSIVVTNKLGTVKNDQATILSGAGSETSVIASIKKNQSLIITGEMGDWYRVKLSDQETGWIAKSQVALATLALKGDMPVPTIKGLESAKSQQFITLTEKLQESETAREKIQQQMEEREHEVEELREKVANLTESHKQKASKSQEEIQRERQEREQAAQRLKEQEHEMERLRTQLDSIAQAQTDELTTMQEKLKQEKEEREQAEHALQQFRSELQQLRSQLDEYTSAASIKQTPPAIALATPLDGKEVKIDRILLTGAAASEKGVSRIEIRVNDELLVRRQGRGVAVVPGQRAIQPTLEFSESVILQEGKNVITITAFDDQQLSTTRTLNVTRLVDKGKIWAVVIGISEYERVRPLKYADKDASAFHEYLLQQVGIPQKQVTFLTNDDATLFNLKRTLGTDLKRKAGPQDTVIIYYAGHGAPETDAMSPDGDGLEKYLIPYDADPQDLYSTGLPMREVETIFRRLSAERVIFITDSCYSGATAGRTFSTAARRATVSDNFLSRLAKGKGRVVLTASRAGEVSEERDDLQHGVFTFYLLQGLKGGADYDADGIITVDEAYSYVSTHVPQVTGQNQHPVKKGEFEGQLILGRVQDQ